MNTMSRSGLIWQVLARFGTGLVVMGLVFFVSAGTIGYWHAWLYMGILFIPMFFVFVYLLRNDPALLERRMHMKEKQSSQKFSMKVSVFFYILAFVIPGVDFRFNWSSVPIALVVFADTMVFLGYMVFFVVLRENSYASRIVEVEENQKVISTGPYAIVRHPMYVGILIMFLFSPVALGSFWALIAMLPVAFLIVRRIKDEERLLSNDLPGYEAYRQKVKYRLIPMVW
jgi:protein-S-isoprenylcysteine O-methyltransferase Ste14